MTKQDIILQTELYTERLNDMYARISEFQTKAPYNLYFDELEQKGKDIAIAHRRSRFYPDKDHFAQWESLLADADTLLKKAGCRHE